MTTNSKGRGSADTLKASRRGRVEGVESRRHRRRGSRRGRGAWITDVPTARGRGRSASQFARLNTSKVTANRQEDRSSQ